MEPPCSPRHPPTPAHGPPPAPGRGLGKTWAGRASAEQGFVQPRRRRQWRPSRRERGGEEAAAGPAPAAGLGREARPRRPLQERGPEAWGPARRCPSCRPALRRQTVDWGGISGAGPLECKSKTPLMTSASSPRCPRRRRCLRPAGPVFQKTGLAAWETFSVGSVRAADSRLVRLKFQAQRTSALTSTVVLHPTQTSGRGACSAPGDPACGSLRGGPLLPGRSGFRAQRSGRAAGSGDSVSSRHPACRPVAMVAAALPFVCWGNGEGLSWNRFQNTPFPPLPATLSFMPRATAALANAASQGFRLLERGSPWLRSMSGPGRKSGWGWAAPCLLWRERGSQSALWAACGDTSPEMAGPVHVPQPAVRGPEL